MVTTDVTEDGHQMPLNTFKIQVYHQKGNIHMPLEIKHVKKLEEASEFQAFYQLLVVLDYQTLLTQDHFPLPLMLQTGHTILEESSITVDHQSITLSY
jgi:hypothetical protein